MLIIFEHSILTVILIVVLVSMRKLTMRVTKDNIYKQDVTCIECIFFLIIFSHFMYEFCTLEKQECIFRHNCFGTGEDDLLYYDEVVYETYNKCSNSATVGYDIRDYYEKYYNEEEDCRESEYGCCILKNRCEISYEYNFTYDQYWDRYSSTFNSERRGKINTEIKKVDEEGSNCPSYDDIFMNRVKEETIEPLYFFIIMFIWIMIYYCYLIFCKKVSNFEEIKKDSIQSGSV